jgi:HK97 family phage portal protein
MERRMKLFDFFRPRAQKKEAPPYSPNIYEQKLQYIPMALDYRTFVREGYKTNGPFYRSITTIIEAIGGLEWGLYADKTLEREIMSDPVLDILNSPNPFMSTGEYFEHLAGYWLLSGNSYIFANRPAKTSPPVELWILRPDYTHVVPGRFGPLGYKYGTLGQEKDYTSEEVAHLKFFSGDDSWYGLSPAQVSALLVDQLNASLKWNTALMQNMARPSGAWVAKATLSRIEFERLKKELRSNYSSPENAGLPMVLDADIEWRPYSLTPHEADYQKTIENDANWIANIFGIAPELAGSGNRTYSNMPEARQALYEDRVFPLADRIQDKLNSWLLPMFPNSKGAYITYKKDKVEALRTKYEEARKNQEEADQKKKDGVVKLYNGATITLNEAREALGYKPVPNGDVIKVGSSLLPLDGIGRVPEAPNDNQDAGDQQNQKALNLRDSQSRANYLSRIEQTRERWYAVVEEQLATYFKQEHESLKSAISASISQSTNDIAAYEKIIEKTLEDKQDDLRQILVSIYKDVGSDFHGMIAQDITNKAKHILPSERKDIFGFLYEAVLNFIDTVSGYKVKQIMQNTLETLRDMLHFGVEQGLPIPDIAALIDLLYLNTIIPNRSTLIARTEVVSASNYGSQVAARQAQDAGLNLKKVWLSTSDRRTRPTHQKANGQTVPLNQPFTISGHKLMFPGDTSLGAPASETVQCRCTEYYEEESTKMIENPDPPCYNDVRTTRQDYREFMRRCAND